MQKENKMKIGMIEVSHWHARTYIDSLKNSATEVIAVSDRNSEIATRVKNELGCQHYYRDYHELVEKEKLDFVFAFGRHYEMPLIAKQLIEENINFAMEKPVAIDSQNIKELADLADKKGIFVAVALAQRISPMVRQLIEWRDKDELGDFTHLCMRYIAGPPDRYIKGTSEWMLDKNQAGGGCTINLAVHYVDMFTYLTGKRVKNVFAKMNSLTYQKEVEDSSTMVLASEDGTVGAIDTGYARPTVEAEEYHTFCTTKSYVTFRKNIMEREDREGKRNKTEMGRDNLYTNFIENTLNNFKKGGRPIADLNDMYEVMRVVNRAYESNLNNKVMMLGGRL
jgi:predicted dehydrogenase